MIIVYINHTHSTMLSPKIIIIDGPPSTWVTQRVEILRKQDRSWRIKYIPDFTHGFRYGDPLSSTEDLSRTIVVAVTRFTDIISFAQQEWMEEVVLDGSPITLRALGTIYGIKPNEDALSMLRELGKSYANRVNVQLMMPAKWYIYPADMKRFDPKKIPAYSHELRSAYMNRGFRPITLPIQRSPYA